MKTVFETAECEEVRNCIFWVQRYEKHEDQMKGCAVEPKVSVGYKCTSLSFMEDLKSLLVRINKSDFSSLH